MKRGPMSAKEEAERIHNVIRYGNSLFDYRAPVKNEWHKPKRKINGHRPKAT
jgi:hypothetical protein